MSNVETKRLRTNHTIQKQTLKALHQAKKRRTEDKWKKLALPLYLLTYYSIYYRSLIQFLAKGCTNTGWLYKLPSLLIQNRIYTPRYLRSLRCIGTCPFQSLRLAEGRAMMMMMMMIDK
ncbi:hypothetical protein EVAR_98515_1 [Eumeta japonica]|uniref:Uncharacterized protein n=1 Tax=Eumeta variegata TaxID=151549 RepID=A0A4C1SX59_EUMVA|nr:hypothetical protein EVAR_98515_1 [Eumeta japonica]